MARKFEECRYPESADLFQYCKEVLILKNERPARVHDQKIGDILSFDPADASHWKYGRKKVSSLSNLKKLSEALGVDIRYMEDILLQRSSPSDAKFDCHGFHEFGLYSEVIRKQCLLLASEICADIREFPVFLPELAQQRGLALPEGNNFNFQSRLQGAQYLSSEVLKQSSLRDEKEFDMALYVRVISLYVLSPTHLVDNFLQTADLSCDLSAAFMRAFWVSRGFANLRLRDYLLFGN